MTDVESVTEPNPDVFTNIENYAHDHQVLLSSDAIRYFVSSHGEEGIFFALGRIIEKAKASYPSEDGWLVINLERLEKLVGNGHVSGGMASYAALAAAPTGVGSLAEAIVTGNVAASYKMIANRPMVALAEAAADLDTIYRLKTGQDSKGYEPSELLREATTSFSPEEVSEMIKSLTTALDGTYTDEQSAVKMAIVKAIRVVNQ